MKFDKKLLVFLGCAALVAGMSVGLMGCPEEDDDDFGKSQIRMEAPAEMALIQA